MDCRTSTLLAFGLTFLGAGCVTSPLSTTTTLPGSSGEEATSVARTDASRKTSATKLMTAVGAMKEKQAQEAAGKPDVQQKLRDGARLAYLESLRLDPSGVEAQRGLARTYAASGNLEQAFEVYKKALAHTPASAGLWYDKGQCHNRRKEWPEAIKCFEKALALEPDNRQVMTSLGLTLARAGQVDQSLTYLARASNAAVAHYNVARMQLHMGQTDAARGQLNDALRDNPNLADARDLLASLDTNSASTTPTRTPTLQFQDR